MEGKKMKTKASFLPSLSFILYKLTCSYKQWSLVFDHYFTPQPGICLFIVMNDKWNYRALCVYMCMCVHVLKHISMADVCSVPLVIDHSQAFIHNGPYICLSLSREGGRDHKETCIDQTQKGPLHTMLSILTLEKLLSFLSQGEDLLAAQLVTARAIDSLVRVVQSLLVLLSCSLLWLYRHFHTDYFQGVSNVWGYGHIPLLVLHLRYLLLQWSIKKQLTK